MLVHVTIMSPKLNANNHGMTPSYSPCTGNEPWKSFQAMDLTRAAARGKPFWHAEAQSGSLWMQSQVVGRPREDGRISYPKDVRLWKLTAMAGGATGIFDMRWRPLLDGPLFGAFGGFGMDGSVTPQAEMGGKVARWANAHPAIWKSRPAKGEVGIVFVPESQIRYARRLGRRQEHGQLCCHRSCRGISRGDVGPQGDHASTMRKTAISLLYRSY